MVGPGQLWAIGSAAMRRGHRRARGAKQVQPQGRVVVSWWISREHGDRPPEESGQERPQDSRQEEVALSTGAGHKLPTISVLFHGACSMFILHSYPAMCPFHSKFLFVALQLHNRCPHRNSDTGEKHFGGSRAETRWTRVTET